MNDAANFALLVLLLESARQWNRPGDFAEGTFLVWLSAIQQLKALLPNASPPSFSSVDQNLLNAFINAAIVTPPEPLDQVVYNAQIAVVNEPGMQEHYEFLLLIELAVVARGDTTLTWQDVFIKAVGNIGLAGLEPELIMGWNIDMNVVNAFVQQLRANPDKSIADAINDAKNGVVYEPPSASELLDMYCGYEGFPCCKDPIDSCREPDLLCDTDEHGAEGMCRRNLWPPASAYSVNQTVPGDELDTDWTEELQGVATDGRFWYIVQDNRMRKVPFNIDWTEDWGPLDWEELGIKRVDNGSFATKCDHWGDPDVHNGRVYVPLEDCPVGGGETQRALAEFDANTLEVTGMRSTGTPNAASVAIHPRTGEFYIMQTFGPGGTLNVYAARGETFELTLQRTIPLEVPNGMVLDRMQGIAFGPSGKLYVSCDLDDGIGGIYAFQVSHKRAIFERYLYIEEHPSWPPFLSEELQGLTVHDVIWDNGVRNQIHVFLLHNRWPADDNAWFKHIAVGDNRF